MTQVGQIYKCAVCGNTVEVKAASVGELVCCGQSRSLVSEKQETPAVEQTMSEVKAERQEAEITEVTSEPSPEPSPSPSQEPETTQ